MAAKTWMQDRWEMLMPVLAGLTVDQEEEIARVCQEEIAYWRERPTMQSLSSLNTPMTFMRNKIRKTFVDLTDSNSYVNPRSGKREHIALKYPNMNFSPEEWRAISAPSAAAQQRRMESQQTIEDPDVVVAKGAELLQSSYWPDRVVAIALGLGLRLSEVLGPKTEIYPHTRYSVDFSGQLKRRDKILLPYERPTLMEASGIIDAWRWIREQVEWKGLESDEINDRYGQKVIEAAIQQFSRLVPPREDGELYTHLFRAVYGTIAIFYYCPPHVHALTYLNTILGHYWIDENGNVERDYKATLHYDDYQVSDAAVLKYRGKRQGVRLDDPGVEILGIHKPKEVSSASSSKRKGKRVSILPTDKPKGHSIIRVNPPTEGRVITLHDEENHHTYDDTVSLLLDEHYMLKQLASLLSPLYEQLGAATPLRAVEALLGDGGAYQVNEQLGEQYQTSLPELVGILDEAAADSGEKTSAEYLRELVQAKRTFKKSYEKRHKDKDYSTLSTSELRRTKMPGAAEERFRRAVDAIIKHNDRVEIPEFRRYVSPAFVVDLVGGRPLDAKEYIATRQPGVEEHHKKYGLTPGINRIPLISVRVEVPEWPEGVEPTESPEPLDAQRTNVQEEIARRLELGIAHVFPDESEEDESSGEAVEEE